MQQDMSTTTQAVSEKLNQKQLRQNEKVQDGQKKENPILCINNNKAIFLCSTQSCQKSGFICRNDTCSCLDHHNHNLCMTVSLKGFIQNLSLKKQKIPKQIKTGLDYVNKIYSDLIQKLSIYRQNIQIFKFGYGMNFQEAKVFYYLKNQNYYCITGDEVFKANLNQKQISKLQKSALNLMKQFESLNKNPYIQLQVNQIQYQINKQSGNWNIMEKSDKVDIIKNKVRSSSQDQIVVLINKNLKSKEYFSWRLQLKKKGNSIIKMGICCHNQTILDNYKLTSNNRYSLIDSEGYSQTVKLTFTYYNSKNQFQNFRLKNTNFQIQQGNIIHIFYNSHKKKIFFFNQIKKLNLSMQVKEEQNQKDFCPCVVLSSGSEIQIIQSP